MTKPSTASEKQISYCKRLRDRGAELEIHTTYTDP